MTTSLITTGGTIGWSDTEQRMLSGDELARSAHLTFDSVTDLLAVPSWDLNITDVLTIVAAVLSAIDAGHHSVIVTHGTDTMEESAWLTDLLLGAERRSTSRVLFTGAMRYSDNNDSDGPANLEDAFRQAMQTQYPNQGVQIAFAGKLHAARWAEKIDAFNLDAFASGSRPPSSGPLPPTNGAIDTNVELVIANSVARQAIPEYVHGVIIQGTGAAHVPSKYFEQIERLWNRGVPVVLATRTRDVARTFDGVDRVLWAGDLTPEKATLALMAALGVSSQLPDVCDWWSTLMSQSIR